MSLDKFLSERLDKLLILKEIIIKVMPGVISSITPSFSTAGASSSPASSAAASTTTASSVTPGRALAAATLASNDRVLQEVSQSKS